MIKLKTLTRPSWVNNTFKFCICEKHKKMRKLSAFVNVVYICYVMISIHQARLAQSVEHETLNLGVVGSSPTLGAFFFFFFLL